MPLANISTAPRPSQQAAFDYSHYQDHVQIVQAINKQKGLTLPIYPLYPSSPTDSWQRLHQQFHMDMNKALKTSGNDLTGEIDNQWYIQNFREHSAARQVLGI
jgi:hypothetical protein